ncbi:hypothetical protein SUGI_1124920 [Cryptomeria japonica]|nr:hypothetical protein SUGI_1124920 [Cryptomeria japonica]
MAPSASAMGISSTLIQKQSYDVFINHRGRDVKKTLATKIYDILGNMKVTAFLDSEELEYGDFFPRTLEAVVRGATLHIAIFSEGYAESPWCLEELSLMLKSGTKIIPIFYHLEPTDIRHVARGKGMYVAAFKKHEENGRYEPEKLKEWKDALYKVSFYIGQIVKSNDDEMRLYKNIVNIVLKEISNVPLVVAKHPVGLDEIVKDFENTVQLADGDQSVQVVGIWGMGGSGKTTLAKKLYNERSLSMERSSFIFDIREAKEKLQTKQTQLLKGLGVDKAIDNVEEGKAILEKHLKPFKVLIVMDDVDHVDQLDALLPAKGNLRNGSLIIVTTREHQVLTSWGISSVYKMRALDQSNAEELFCWHAFLQPCALDGFEELVKSFIEVCDGLPLSMKVFGAQLYGNSSKQYWKSLFHKISRILPEEIKKRLKISYDDLDDEEKEAFLDVACFFIGEKNSLAIEFWDGSEWSGLLTWKRLLNKSLVEVDYENCIRMYDHLRDLGREIASQHSPSRIWLSEQIINFGKQKKEKRNDIRGIKIAPTGIKELLLYREAFTPYLAGLKLLVIDSEYLFARISGEELTNLVQGIGEVSTELVWICWCGFPERNLARLSLKNLRVLQLSRPDCLEELWEAESDAPVQLRELSIFGCPKFQRFPNSMGCLNELKKIVIRGCGNTLRSLPEEFCRLQLLEHLELEECGMLSSLPSSFGDLRNLRYLLLIVCEKLRSLPVSFKNLILLQYLDLSGCTELIFRPDDFQNITTLEYLNLFSCVEVKELPRHIINQASLRELNLTNVEKLRELPAEIGQLSRLRKMDIWSCRLLISLPNSLGDLSSLTYLGIHDCDNLKSLPTSLGDLSSLTYLGIHDCDNLKSLPTSRGDLSSLTHLEIQDCPKLECLPFSVWRLSLLEHLDISKCPIIDFEAPPLSSALSNLKRMKLNRTKVCRILVSDHYPRLESLELHYNDDLTEIKALPVKLECLDIRGSPKLVELPSFAQLTSLREFKLQGCDRIEKIEGLKHCTRLEILILHTCWEVPGIESLEHMERLKRVELRANKGSAIVSCIQTIQKWPDLHEIIICTRVVPDVSSLLDSFKLGLSPNLSVDENILDCAYFSDGNAVMLCHVINCDSSSQGIINSLIDDGSIMPSMEIGEGRWAYIGFFTQRSRCLADYVDAWTLTVVRDFDDESFLGVSGEERSVGEAFLSLVNIL